MPRIHPLTGWACLLTLILLWMPNGLIHQGQKQINPAARPIVPCTSIVPFCVP